MSVFMLAGLLIRRDFHYSARPGIESVIDSRHLHFHRFRNHPSGSLGMEGGVDGEFADSPGRLQSHLFEDPDRCAGEIEFISFREDSHDRHHSGAEGASEEVGR